MHQAFRLTALIGAKSRGWYTVYMINLLLTLSLFNIQPAAQTAQFKPCVWPNVCKNETPAPIVEISPVEVAQFTTCVYPRKCGKSA